MSYGEEWVTKMDKIVANAIIPFPFKDGARDVAVEQAARSIAIARHEERERCAKLADGWLIKFGSYKPLVIGAQGWANDAVKDIAAAIRNGHEAV